MASPKRAVTLGAALLVLGAGLLILSYLLTPPGAGLDTPDGGEPRATAPWLDLPPRAPQPKDPVEAGYLQFHRALLRGDLVEAERALVNLTPEVGQPDARLAMAHARLALAMDDAAAAADHAWVAVGQAPEDPWAWSLLGAILMRTGELTEAGQALAITQELDPSLADVTLPARWRSALTSGDAAATIRLAEEFTALHPDDAIAPYYRAEGLLSAGSPSEAVNLLVTVLRSEPASPALLWYALGRSYLALDGYLEAATSLEAAANRVARGDTSLEHVSTQPLDDLNALLALAYLRTDRCAEAEAILRRLATVRDGLEPLVTSAVVCQTPTPTLTPWIPQQIGTVTPLP